MTNKKLNIDKRLERLIDEVDNENTILKSLLKKLESNAKGDDTDHRNKKKNKA